MVTRTQITLDRELHRRARAKAAELGVSLAEYVRRLVTADLTEERPRVGVESIFGLGDSGGSDIARHKDEYVGEAVAALRKRS